MALVLEPDHISIVGVNFVSYDVEELSDQLAARLRADSALSIVERQFGADRAQVLFRYQQTDYMLHVESNCEAIWIESLRPSRQNLQNLYQHLCQHTVMQ